MYLRYSIFKNITDIRISVHILFTECLLIRWQIVLKREVPKGKVLSTNYVKQSSGRVARIIRLVKFMHIHVIIGLV